MSNRGARNLAFVVTLYAFCHVAVAGQQFMPTDRFQARNPNQGLDSTRRRIFYEQEERHSGRTIVGDPSVSGATLRVSIEGGGEQCFDFPAAGWLPLGNLGFKYKSPGGMGAAAVGMVKKEGFSGDFILKWKLIGGKGPINVVPHAASPSFAVDFKIGDGDEYCAGGPTPTGGSNTDAVYSVRSVPPPATCAIASCSPTGP